MKPLLALSCLALCGCAVTVPIGEDGRYGELYAGYRPPAIYVPILHTPVLFSEK